MKSLVYFELKKIFKRKFNVIAMLAGYLLILVCVVSFIRGASFWEEESQSYVEGVRAFQRAREKNDALTDFLTEEYLTGLVEDIQGKDVDLDTDEGYMQVIRPIRDMIWILCSNYTDIGEDFEWGMAGEIPSEGGIHFYERRMEKVADYLNMDFSYGNYSEREKEFWIGMEQEVETPFRWGDRSSMDIVWDTIQTAFYLLFVITVCVSPVFAAEYESGAAALLLTTRNGKTRLICAKVAAVALFSLSYLAVGIGLGVAIEGVAVGFHGAGLPIQLWGTHIPYNWSVGETCVVSFGMLLLATLMITLFGAFLSARVKSSMATLVICFVILIAPAFLPMSRESGLWNHINYLFPIRLISMKDVLRTFNSYQFGTVVVSYPGMAAAVYAIVSLVSLLGIKNGFARHQVGR